MRRASGAARRAAVESLEGRALFAVTLSPVADAGVSSASGGVDTTAANFGADPVLPVQSGATNDERSYLRFDISSAPADLTGATLRLRGEAGAAASVGVFPVASVTWVEGDGSYPVGSNDDTPAGEVTFATAPPRSSPTALDAVTVNALQNYAWDVGAYVQQQKAAGATSVTFLLDSAAGAATPRATFNAREAAGTKPTLVVDEPAPPAGPVATIVAANRTAPSATHQVIVTYADPDGVATNTINAADLTVARVGGGPEPTVSVANTNASNPNSVVVTYDLTGPGGAWDIADNDTYTVALAAGQVTDTGGAAATGAPDNFTVNIPDEVPPVAQIAAANLTTGGGTTYQFTVTYTDDQAIRASTIGPGDVSVSRAGGPDLTITDADVTPGGNGTPRTVTYTVDAPGANWDAGDNGTFDIEVRANAVRDTSDNGVLLTTGSFQVQIVDAAGPTADVNAPNLNTGGAPTYSFTVTYADNAAVDVGAIGVDDVTVSGGPGGGGPLTVTGFSVNAATSGTPRTATYTVAAPGGSWDAGDNGDYVASVVAGGVADSAGNPVTAASDGFRVNIRGTSAPTASISPVAAVVTRGGTSQTFTVTYADDTAVDAATIDVTDVTVTRVGVGPLPVALVSVTPSGNGTPLTAVYSVTPPGGFWSVGDNGAYTVAVGGGAVEDLDDNGNAAAQQTFSVNIEPTGATVDDSFNGGDVINTGFVAEAVATDAAGGILIAGHQGDRAAGTAQSVLQRLNRDGSLDTFFGQGGQVIGAPGDNEAFYAIAVDIDGRILVAGHRGGDAVVERFKANGAPDRTFGARGLAVVDFGGTGDVAYGLVIASDGNVVIAGGTGGADGSFAVARLTPAGRPDAGFGAEGKRAFKRDGATGNVLGGVAVAADGSVYAVGAADAAVVVAHLDAAGNPDGAFGPAGVRAYAPLANRTDLNAQDRTQAIALQRDGKVLVANQTAAGDFAVLRLTPAGDADASFDNDGLATVDFDGGDDDVDVLALQATGQIVAVGTSDAGGVAKTAVAVFNPDGTLDEDFAAAGKFLTDAGITVGTLDRSLHIGQFILRAFGGLQSDGRLLVGAGDQSQAPTSSPLRRVNVSGSGSVGRFGNVLGRNRKLTFADGDGTRVTVTLKGAGSGEVLYDGVQGDLVLTGTDASTVVTVKASGGEDGRLSLRDLRASGALKSFAGKTTDVSGTFFVDGAAAKLTLGTLAGTLAASGAIGAVTIEGDATNATVLSGADLGADAARGGTSDADGDTYAPGLIGTFTVKGALAASVVGAGLNPVNGAFLDGDDRVEGGADSAIRTIAVRRSTDDATRFVAGAFGKAKLPARVDLEEDSHFLTL